mgnify:FL=1
MFLTVIDACRILNRQFLRSVLTVLGFSIGVGAVIVIESVGQGSTEFVQAQFARLGTNVIWIWPQPRSEKGVRSPKGWAITLTVGDAEDLKGRSALLVDTCWGRRDPTQVVFRGRNWRVPVEGNSPSCFDIGDWSLASGTFFNQEHESAGERVAVVGATVVETLYEDGEDPIGTRIRIKNVLFRVIGVLTPKGYVGGVDRDDVIVIPFTAAQRYVHGAKYHNAVEEIATATFRREDIPAAIAQIRHALRSRHLLRPDQTDDFKIQTSVEQVNLLEAANGTIALLVVCVASASLLVGGIGIMNILLVSVTERTREIGVRMAVGAKRRHILMQFLIEAMTLSVVGGTLGILFGVAGARLTTVIAGWPTIISGNTVVAAFFFSLAVGLFFGLYPANKAARLNPIDALRYE